MSAGRPRREVAHRLFAVEFDDSTVSLTESDDDMAPSYVVTPTGALVNRAFVVGTLTSVEQVGDDIYRGRIADPTETFVSYAGQYQPAAANFLADASPPAIVALTGKARTFQPDGSDEILSSLRPERIIETTPPTRDRWVVETARHTLGRIQLLAQVRAAGIDAAGVGDAIEDVPTHVSTGIQRAIEHYDTSPAYLAAIHERTLEALEVVAGDREAVDPLMLEPDAAAGEDTFEALADGDYLTGWLGHDVTVDATAAPPASTTAATSDDDGPATDEGEPSTPSADEADDDGASDAPPPSPEEEEDDLYELSDAEREAVEAEYDVGFESGSEVEVPTDDQSSDDEPDPDEASPTAASDDADTEEPSPEADDDDATDLESAVLEHMRDLDGGSGADREAVVEAVVEDTGATREAVEDALQDALMSGTCYEPTEGQLKPI